MDSLSDDLVCNILLHLPVEDLLRLSRASKRFQSLVNSESCGGLAWKQLFQQTFPEEPTSQAAPAQQQQQQQQLQQEQQQQEEGQAQGRRGKRPRTAVAHAGSSAGGVRGHSSGNSGPCALPALPAPVQQSVGSLPAPATGEQQAASWKEKFRERYIEQRRQERLRRRARKMRLESSVQVLCQEVHRLQSALREEQGRLEAAQQEVAAIQAERQVQAVRSISRQYWLPEAVQRAQGMVTMQTPVDWEGRLTDASQRVAVCALEVRKLRNQVHQRSARLDEERHKLAALQP